MAAIFIVGLPAIDKGITAVTFRHDLNNPCTLGAVDFR